MSDNVSLINGHIEESKKYNRYYYMKFMDVEDLAEIISAFTLQKIHECNILQRRECKYFNYIPEGGCAECIKNEAKKWLEEEVANVDRIK